MDILPIARLFFTIPHEGVTHLDSCLQNLLVVALLSTSNRGRDDSRALNELVRSHARFKELFQEVIDEAQKLTKGQEKVERRN